MARSESVSLLGLGNYARIMRIDACHFNQVAGAKAPQQEGGCDDVWSQADREDLEATIVEAEALIAEELGFWPAPTWITDEDVWLGRVRSDWWNAEIRTEWGYLQEWGTQSLTLIEANAPVTYVDEDGDYYGREETAKIGDPATLYAYISTTCTDPCRVKVFYRVEDGAWDAADPRWEIRPLSADVDGGNLFITGESCRFVKPSLWDLSPSEEPTGDWKIPFDTNNLVDAVDVYCESADVSDYLTIKYDGICYCNSPCSHETQTGCGYVTDKRAGTFTARPSTWNGTTHVWASPEYDRFPDKVTINYRAGYPLDSRTCRMDRLLERAVVKLTNVLLPEPPCGFCDYAHRMWKNDREQVDPITERAALVPWGQFERGALEAWRIVNKRRLGRGYKLGR